VEAGGSGTGGGGWGWDRWRRVGVEKVGAWGGWAEGWKAVMVTGWAMGVCATGVGNSLRDCISGKEVFLGLYSQEP